MRTEVGSALRKSSQDFLRLVWPAIGGEFGEVIPVETVTANSFARELDMRAGIDAWLVSVDGHMRGLASRVQWTNSSYNTFTVRVRTRYGRPTEYHKRKAELAAMVPAITPHYFVQGYVSMDRTRLVAAAIAPMRSVIQAVDEEIGWLMKPNPDGTQGWAVPWESVSPRKVWPAPQESLW
jgi:hypothetical protein